jgi:hypothetical protein
MPFSLSKCAESVSELVFTGYPWIDIEQYGGRRCLLTMENLVYELHEQVNVFTRRQLKRLVSYFDETGKGFLVQKEVIRLNTYIFCKMARLGQSDAANGSTPIGGGMPASVYSLKNLTHLDLSFQAIRVITDRIASLESLRTLLLNNCILLESLSAKVGNLPALARLELANCISLRTPPPEIVKRGFVAIMVCLFFSFSHI